MEIGHFHVVSHVKFVFDTCLGERASSGQDSNVKKGYLSFGNGYMECMLRGRVRQKLSGNRSLSEMGQFAAKQSEKNRAVTNGLAPEWVYPNGLFEEGEDEPIEEMFTYEHTMRKYTVTKDQMAKLVEKMSDSTALQYGCHMSNSILKNSSHLEELIRQLVNTILLTKKIPRRIRKSRVTPVPKPLKSFADSRPVVILDVIRKVLEYVVRRGLRLRLERFLPRDIIAYRSHKSTLLCMVKLENSVARATFFGKRKLMLFRDVKGAFESEDHIHIALQLVEFGFDTHFVSFILDYLGEQEQVVMCGDEEIPISPPTEGSGAVQGGPLSADLFNVVFAVLHGQYSEDRMTYADDDYKGFDYDVVDDELLRRLEEFILWVDGVSKMIGLKFGINKTEIIVDVEDVYERILR